jgi:hypothetical protein
MPKQLYKLNDFSGGLNTVKDVADINDNEVNTAQNLMFNIYGGMQPAYSMTDSTNNKISSYNNDEITTVQPGYGLGYFETDHVRDPVTVSQTSSIAGAYTIADGAISGGTARTGFAVYKHNTGSLYKEIEYRVSNTQQNLANSFAIGSLLKIEGSGLGGDGLSVAGQGVYTVVQHNGNNIIVDSEISMTIESTTANFWGGTLTGVSLGDQVILLADPAAHNIDVFSTSANNYTHNVITLRSSVTDTASKVKYYKVDDSIRCCDTADNSDSKIQWYGWIQRRHFSGANNAAESNSYMNYFPKDNTLSPPTDGTVASSSSTTGVLASYEKNQNDGSATTASLTAGAGFNLAVTTETDQDGFITSGTYEFAQTFIYDGNQESLPADYSQTLTVSDENNLKSLSLNIATIGPFDPRISGGRIYIREQGTDSEYIMLLDIDLGKGCRTKFSDDYTPWNNPSLTLTGDTTDGSTALSDTSNDLAIPGMTITGTGIALNTTVSAANNSSNVITLSQNATATGNDVTFTLTGSFFSCPDRDVANNFRVSQLGFITYEVINGFSSSIFSNALGDSGEHWKDAVVANNRVFICNVTMKDEDTGKTKAEATLRSYPDRIMYSMPNRYDTFPSDNFIETAKGDADVYVAMESYADRLLAYKHKSLDIINISGDDRNWFLEDSKRYQGILHPEAVKRTQYGVLWVNKQGLFLYDGSSIRDLKENKISDSDWSAHVGSVSGIIYDEQESMAFVIKNLGSNGDAYMCDLKKGNFTLLKDFVLDTNDGITNSVDTEGNQTLIGHDAGSSIDIYQLHRTVAATDGVRFTTKALDFGNPFQVKKIYSVHITYKSDIALTGMFVLREEDNTQTALNGTVSASATNWAKVELTPTSPVVCNKVSLQLNSSTSSAKVYINDISIEYRAIYRKGV